MKAAIIPVAQISMKREPMSGFCQTMVSVDVEEMRASVSTVADPKRDTPMENNKSVGRCV